MNQNIFNGLPKYVRLTVYVQARKLVSTAYFNYEDTEDIIQDLLLYYLEQFYKVPDVDEALVVHSLRLYSYKIYNRRKHDKAHLTSSLDYDVANEDFFYDERITLDDIINRSAVRDIIDRADSVKLKKVLYLIMEGYSVDKISKQLHISKETIYKFFKKIKKL